MGGGSAETKGSIMVTTNRAESTGLTLSPLETWRHANGLTHQAVAFEQTKSHRRAGLLIKLLQDAEDGQLDPSRPGLLAATFARLRRRGVDLRPGMIDWHTNRRLAPRGVK